MRLGTEIMNFWSFFGCLIQHMVRALHNTSERRLSAVLLTRVKHNILMSVRNLASPLQGAHFEMADNGTMPLVDIMKPIRQSSDHFEIPGWPGPCSSFEWVLRTIVGS